MSECDEKGYPRFSSVQRLKADLYDEVFRYLTDEGCVQDNPEGRLWVENWLDPWVERFQEDANQTSNSDQV